MNLIKNYFRKKGFFRLAFPPGHYASPIPDLTEALLELDREKDKKYIPGIDLNFTGQLKVLNQIAPLVNSTPFEDNPSNKFRYHFNNSMFQHSDGSVLYGMIKFFKPKRIVEVGSGFSSALMLDINETIEKEKIKLTFIEPYPERLNSILNTVDRKDVTIVEKKIQYIDLKIFEELNENDILFLDTSHIAKAGSDVTFWTFNILPLIKKGVLVHIHDIFWPFNYSEEWIKIEKCYNEAFFIRAFLQFNESFEIFFFNSYLKSAHYELFNSKLPSLTNHHGGGSLWLRRIK
jgi:predicted O-methyltransferase YrrM